MSGIKNTLKSMVGLVAGPFMGGMSGNPNVSYGGPVVTTSLTDPDNQGKHRKRNFSKTGEYYDNDFVAAEKMRVAHDLLNQEGALATERVLNLGRAGVTIAQSGSYAKKGAHADASAKYAKGILDAIARIQGQQQPAAQAPVQAPAAQAQQPAPAPAPAAPAPAQAAAPKPAPAPAPAASKPVPASTPTIVDPGYTGPTRMVGTTGTLGSQAGSMTPGQVGSKGGGKKRRGRMDTLLSGLGGDSEQFGG